jgi:hypothetical protein
MSPESSYWSNMGKNSGGKPPENETERARLEREAAALAEKLRKQGKITDKGGRHKK